MKLTRFAALVAAAALLTPGQAPAGDKSQSTFTTPGAVSGTSLPGITGPLAGISGVTGKTKGDDKCKVQIQLKGVTIPDTDQLPNTGDEVICVSHVNVWVNGVGALATSAVLRGEVKSGGVKIKADLFAEGVGCIPSGGGGPAISQYESTTACYLPDAAYPDPPVGFASDSSQGVYAAGFGPRPTTGLIATDGLSFKP